MSFITDFPAILDVYREQRDVYAHQHTIEDEMTDDNKPDPAWVKLKKKMAVEHGGRVLQGMAQIWQASLMCDYTLTAGTRSFSVHRMFLAATSDYFHAMLTNGMMETTQNKVELKGITAEGLEPLLHFLYTGDLRICEENALDVLDAASHLQVHSVLKLCLAFLNTNTNVENCVDVLNLSKLYSTDPADIKSNEDYVAKNFALVVQGEHHKRLTFDSFLSLVGRNDLLYGPEMFVFYAVMDWVREDESRAHHMCALMAHVRFPLMSTSEIKIVRDMAPQLWEDKQVGGHMMEALVYLHRPTHMRVTMQTKLTRLRANPVIFVTVYDEDSDQRMYTLDTTRNEWEEFHPVNIEPTLGNPTAIVVVEDFLVCLGERIPDQHDMEEEFQSTPLCKIYDPRERKWAEMAPMLRKYYFLETIVTHGGFIYLVEGYDDFGPDVQDCRIDRYSFKDNKWDVFARMYDGWPLVHSMGACVLNDQLYVAGGCGRHAVSNHIASIDLESRIWEVHEPMAFTKAYHEMFPVANRILFVDGTINGEDAFDMTLVNVDYYEPETESWDICETRYVKASNCRIKLGDSHMFTHATEVMWYAQLLPKKDTNKVTLKKLPHIPNSFDCNPHFILLSLQMGELLGT